MKKKKINIILIILICLIAIFVVYKIDSSNRIKKRIINNTQELINSISKENYEKIQSLVKKTDGTLLSDQEISNFLLNTNLYRITLLNSGQKLFFTYSANADIFNSHKGDIEFNINALDGDIISNKLKYINTGTEDYFVTDKIEKCNKEKERYPVAIDLANGKKVEYSGNPENEYKIYISSFVQDENGNVFLEVIKEAREDLKIATKNGIYDRLNDLKKFNKNYNIEWDNDYKKFSIFYEKNLENTRSEFIMRGGIMYDSIMSQALNKNGDWNLTINYYDYNTKELLKAEKSDKIINLIQVY